MSDTKGQGAFEVASPAFDYRFSVRQPEFDLPQLKFPSIWETQSEMFLEGLRDEVEALENSLRTDQELLMMCWHGHERLRVINISMPSHNVVALSCLDEDGNQAQVTGHMNAVTFSFRVVPIVPPAVRRRIGFTAGSPE